MAKLFPTEVLGQCSPSVTNNITNICSALFFIYVPIPFLPTHPKGLIRQISQMTCFFFSFDSKKVITYKAKARDQKDFDQNKKLQNNSYNNWITRNTPKINSFTTTCLLNKYKDIFSFVLIQSAKDHAFKMISDVVALFLPLLLDFQLLLCFFKKYVLHCISMMNIWMVILFLIFYLIYVLLLGWMARFLNDEVNECTNMSVFSCSWLFIISVCLFQAQQPLPSDVQTFHL